MAAGERSGLRCLRCRARQRVLMRRAARRARGAVSRVAAARSVVARGGGGTSSPPLATLPSPITSPGLRPGARVNPTFRVKPTFNNEYEYIEGDNMDKHAFYSILFFSGGIS